MNLTIEQGDIIFIVGENGCGKTTLIKLLLGLYAPQQGEILLNGKAIDAHNRDDYRQLFTTIFADYYLFDDVVQGDQHIPEDANKYLQRLEIAHKVSVRDGSFTTTDLSTGQRKRLALVNAWLEERPVLVFDEWAADQDPTFRRHLLHRAAAGPQTPGQNHHRHLPRRPLFPHRRPDRAAGGRPAGRGPRPCAGNGQGNRMTGTGG